MRISSSGRLKTLAAAILMAALTLVAAPKASYGEDGGSDQDITDPCLIGDPEIWGCGWWFGGGGGGGSLCEACASYGSVTVGAKACCRGTYCDELRAQGWQVGPSNLKNCRVIVVEVGAVCVGQSCS